MAALARLGQWPLMQQLSASVNWRGRRWQSVLWLAALTLLTIALARPQWGSQVQVVEQEGVQVMVALDVSKSMLAADLKPNRLARAKQEISDLMDHLQGDELGLTLFSGAAFIQFPLTSDYDTARAFLNNANPSVISRPGTAIGAAIQTAQSGFDPQRSSQKVIVILTDGEDHEADVLSVAKEAAQQHIIIYTIGFGSPQGEPIPEVDAQGNVTGYKKDANGQTILSKLDEVALQQIALTTNGRYFRASADGSELDALASALNGLQKAQLESRFTVQKIERYPLFLALAILALVIHELIPDRILTTKRGLSGKVVHPQF
jgi:Ca-activated chloride channel family protein